MPKTVFSASSTGTTPVVGCKNGVALALTISATGTAQLQVYIDGDWVGLRTADTASVANVVNISLPEREEPYQIRWNVTANAGTVTTYVL